MRRTLVLSGVLIAASVGIAAPAATASAPAAAAINCAGYDFPDNGLQYCVYPGAKSGECLVTEKRTTFLGTETRCVQRKP